MEHIERRRTSIAAELRAERARRKLTMQQLANGSQIKIATLRRRLDGIKAFDIDQLDRLTTFLALPLVTLIERAEAHSE